VAIDRPDQVWSTDITYVGLPGGFMYLAAVIDWHSRYVLSWELSNTLDGAFCLEALEAALARGCRSRAEGKARGCRPGCWLWP
jgi:putative transposase